MSEGFIGGGGVSNHGDLTGVTADQHHAQSHSHASHTGIGSADHHDHGANVLKSKIIDIGDWNMDTTVSKAVAHGLTFANIRGITVILRNDADTEKYDFHSAHPSATTRELVFADSTNITMERATGGTFDGVSFDSTGFNRGWITVYYI